MSHLSDRADIDAAIGHVGLAMKLLETLNYEEFGMAEGSLRDAAFELHSWKDQPKFTKRGSYNGP